MPSSTATTRTDGPTCTSAASGSQASSGITMTTGRAPAVATSAKAAAVLPADATTSVRRSSGSSRPNAAIASSSLKVAVRIVAPRSGHQPLKAIHRSRSPSWAASPALRYTATFASVAIGRPSGSQR